MGVKSFIFIKLVKRFRLLSLKLTLKLKSIPSLAKSKGDYTRPINTLGTLDKEAIKLLNLIKEVHLSKIRKE